MSSTSDWLTGFNTLDAVDKQQILTWYKQSEDQTKNPGRFIGLNEQTKLRFEFINKILIDTVKLDNVQIKPIMDNLKSYYNTIDDTTQKYELVLFDLINAIYRFSKNNTDITEFNPVFDIKNQFPNFEAHFKKEKLDILNFNAFFKKPTDVYDTIGFICSFRQIITKDVIEKLDKAAEIDDTNKSISSSFAYQCELELCYLSIIIKMIVFSYKDDDLSTIVDTSIDNWLNNYPFRILNSKGDFTPDNFFLTANRYIRNNNVDIQKRLNSYYAFFNKLKNTRTPAKVTINSCIDFLDLYDSGNTYKTFDYIGAPDKSMRSIYFREDFDYLNSLLFRGINLTRIFWIDVDKKVEAAPNKKLGAYLLLLSNAKDITEFYNTIANELGIENGFTQAMYNKTKRYDTICKTPDDDLKNIFGDFAIKEQEEHIESPPEYLDIQVLEKDDYKKYANKNVTFISREINIITELEYKYYKEYSEDSKLIFKEDGKTGRSYRYCLGSTCDIISFDDLQLNINTREEVLKEPIYRETYSDIEKSTEFVKNLLQDVDKRKIHIYWLYFTVKKEMEDGSILSIKTQFDVIHANSSSIQEIYDTFKSHENIFLISIDYGKLPDETLPTIKTPNMPIDTYNQKMAEINQRIDKLQNETMVKYKNAIRDLEILGEKRINFQRQIFLNAQASEISANATQKAEAAKAKADSKAALDKILKENEEKKNRAAELQREAEAELARVKEVGEKLKQQREADRAKMAKEMEDERVRREAEAEEKLKEEESNTQIKDNDKTIKKGMKGINKQRDMFDTIKEQFNTIYKDIENQSDDLKEKKAQFDTAVTSLTTEFDGFDTSLQSIEEQRKKLMDARTSNESKENIKKATEELITEQEILIGTDFYDGINDTFIENITIMKESLDAAEKLLNDIKSSQQVVKTRTSARQKAKREGKCPDNFEPVGKTGFCKKKDE